MNHLKFLAFVFFFSIFQTSIGQEDSKKVKMPKYYKAGLPAKAIPVAGIQVIQAVPDSNQLGFLEKGLDNQKVTAAPSKDLSLFLQEYITKQYSDDYKKEGVRLLWVIKDLRINERTFFTTQKAFARLHADAYVSKDDSLYSFVTAFDTVQVYSSMMDVTSSHGENIAAALHKLLVQTLNKAEIGLTDSLQKVTTNQVIAHEQKRFQFPIISDTVYKEGAYLNFQEFLQNDPSVTNYEIQLTDKKNTRIISVNQDGVQSDLMPWGICKGNELYKYHENDLIPIEKNDNGFIISDYLEKINRRNSGMFAAAIFGGAIGAGIASSSSPKMYSVTSIPYITKKTTGSLRHRYRYG